MAALIRRWRWVDWDRVQTGALNVIVLGALLFIGLQTSVWSFEVDVEGLLAWWSGFLQNFSTEMYGAVLTFFLIEVLVGGRQARQAEREALKVERDRLILEMGSPFNQTAVEAVRQLRWRRWLKDGSLESAYLERANLEGANVGGANLEGATLAEAKLEGASLRGAKLAGATLWQAKLAGATLAEAKLEGANVGEVHLEGATLYRANLEGANLLGANLAGADLRRANLAGADLWGANLAGAKVTCSQLLQVDDMRETTLPDGTVLPDDDTWRAALEVWCETVATHEDGYVVATPLDSEDDD